MEVGRNAPCPCGSGRKHKLCCGTTREQERELQRAAAVFGRIAELPRFFPRLRPTGNRFSAWAENVAGADLDGATVEEGIALLEPRERRRIERAQRKKALLRRQGSGDAVKEELASRALLTGAVVAALEERLLPDVRSLELLEELAELRGDACQALAAALDCGDLWSVGETMQLDAALRALPDDLDDAEYDVRWHATAAAEAARLGSRWHRQRLTELVRRLESQLPLSGYPLASATLSAACDDYERDAGLRARLAAALLLDSLSWTRLGLLAA